MEPIYVFNSSVLGTAGSIGIIVSCLADLRERLPRKRGLQAAEGTPEPDEAEQQQPRKRHRLAMASKSASPAPSLHDAAAASQDADDIAEPASREGGSVHGNGTVEAGAEEEVASPRKEQPDSHMSDAGVEGDHAGSGQDGGESLETAELSNEPAEQQEGFAEEEDRQAGPLDHGGNEDTSAGDVMPEGRDAAQDLAAEDGETPPEDSGPSAGVAGNTEASDEEGDAADHMGDI